MRPSGRAADELRTVTLDTNVNKHAEGSCFIKMGKTQVFCLASVEKKVPPWMRNSGKGWVTAEYGMLPRSTGTRMNREATKGKQSGRTLEIQRLIGRSLRAVTDLSIMGEIQVTVDCDVIQADGGTRTASITGAYVALHLAFQRLVGLGVLKSIPITDEVAAISCGLFEDNAILDLDYAEDSSAQADANFVLTGKQGIVEIQGTAEKEPFSSDQFNQLITLARKGIDELIVMQRQILGII